jgi:hypothetical protein
MDFKTAPACASDNSKRRKRNYVEGIGRGVKTRSVAVSFGRKFCQGVGRMAMSFVLDLDLVSLPKPSGLKLRPAIPHKMLQEYGKKQFRFYNSLTPRTI